MSVTRRVSVVPTPWMLIFNSIALGVVVVAPRVIAMLIEITRMLQIVAPIRVWREYALMHIKFITTGLLKASFEFSRLYCFSTILLLCVTR